MARHVAALVSLRKLKASLYVGESHDAMLEVVRRRFPFIRLLHTPLAIDTAAYRSSPFPNSSQLERRGVAYRSHQRVTRGAQLWYLKRGLDQRRWCETQITSLDESRISDLFIQIQDCSSSRAVSKLAAPLLPSMGVDDLCALLQAYRRFSDLPESEALKSVAERLIQQKSTILPRHIARIFHHTARLQYVHSDLFETVAQQSMLPFQVEAYTHREVSVVMHSIGCLVRDASRKQKRELESIEFREVLSPHIKHQYNPVLFPSQSSFMELLVRRFVTVTEYDSVMGWHVANAVYGVAATRSVEGPLLKKLADMVVHGPIFRSLSDSALCNLVNCFGFMEHHDPDAEALILSEITSPARLPILTESALSDLIQGIAVLQYRNRDHIQALAAEVLRPWRLKKYTDREFTGFWYHFARMGICETAILDALAKEAMQPERLQSMSSKSLHSILASMAQLKYRNNEFLRAFVEEVASERRLTNSKDNHYPAYVWFFGQLRYNNAVDIKRVMQNLAQSEKLEKLPAKTVASIFYGFSQCLVEDQSSAEALLKECAKRKRLKEFSAHSLASLVYSVGRMELSVTPEIDAIMREALKPDRMTEHSEYGLVAMIHGLTHLNVSDDTLLSPLLNEIRKKERVDAYQPGALTCLVLGLSSLRSRDADLVSMLSEEIVKTDKLQKLGNSGASSLVISFSELKLENLDVLEKLLTRVVNSPEIRQMSNSMLSAFVYALGQLRYNHSQKLLLPIMDELAKRRSAFKNHELGAVVNGLGHMGLQHRDIFTLQYIVNEALESHRVASYSIKELGRVCSGLSLMEYSGPNMEPLLQQLFRPDIFQNLDFRDLAGSAYALGHAGVKDDAMLEQLKAEIVKRGKRIETSQRYFSLLIQGIAPMCRTKDHALGQMLLELLHYQYGENIDELTNQNLTAILYGLAQIGVENKAMLYPFVLDGIKTRRLQQYTAHGMSTLIYGLGQFRFRDTKKLMPLVQEVTMECRFKRFSNRQLMGTIFSLCNMEIVQERLLEPLLRAASCPDQLAKCSGSDLSMLFFCLVKIKPQNQSYLQTALNEVTHPKRIKSLDDTALNAILFSMTGLRDHARRPAVLRAIVDQFCLPGKIEEMKGETLGGTMYSLGRLDFLPMDFMDVVATELMKPQRLTRLSETALCNVINTVGKCKYDNRGFMVMLMEEAMRSQRLSLYHEGHILNITYALGTLRFRHPRFLAFMDRVLSDLHEVNKFQPKTLLMIMHAYYLLGVGSHQIVANVSKSVLSNPDRLGMLSDAQLSSLMNTLGYIQRNDRLKQESLDRTA